MRVEYPKMPADALLLDRKESGLLHFVKYQGLGYDFMMVRDTNSLLTFRFLISWAWTSCRSGSCGVYHIDIGR